MVPRAGGYDPDDYHDPTAGIAGAPPARSALGLRLVLAIFGLAVCVAGAVAFAAVGLPAGAVVLGVLAAVALVDAIVVRRRIRIERRTVPESVGWMDSSDAERRADRMPEDDFDI